MSVAGYPRGEVGEERHTCLRTSAIDRFREVVLARAEDEGSKAEGEKDENAEIDEDGVRAAKAE